MAIMSNNLKWLVASVNGLGSHVFTYTNGQLATDTWTLFKRTYVKTYTYTNSVLTSVSDWIEQ